MQEYSMAHINKLMARLDSLGKICGPGDYLLLFLRLWAAKIFYMSGRTKAGDGFFTPSETTFFLFEEEYALPVIDPVLAAHLALYAETFLPMMLLLGLGARLGALGLMGMTLTIQIFVYPASFPEHATWIAALLPVFMMGPGGIALDRLIASRVQARWMFT